MKILYVTTIGITMGFFESLIEGLISDGHSVDVASNVETAPVPDCYREWGCKVYQIDCSRSPFSKGNLTAISQIKEIVDGNAYDIVHCHTPIAAMCTRLACISARKRGTKVFYTAHGFHFFKGAPLKNWLVYYPVEWFCAHFTDVLITINQEDYALAQKRMRAKKVTYVPGVGIDLKKFSNVSVDRTEKRASLGIPTDAILLLSVGELNENKNHQVIIRAMAQLDDPKVYYAIAGMGAKADSLMALARELGVENRVFLLGYRTDIAKICHVADIFCLPSHREGLGLAALEAMACGLPLITSNVHGINDYSENGVTGYKCAPDDVDGFAKAIKKLIGATAEREAMGHQNIQEVKRFEQMRIIEAMKEQYVMK